VQFAIIDPMLAGIGFGFSPNGKYQVSMMTKRFLQVTACFLLVCTSLFATEGDKDKDVFSPQSIVAVMNKANDYQLAHPWRETDRNWIRPTYYTGVMAFYEASGDCWTRPCGGRRSITGKSARKSTLQIA